MRRYSSAAELRALCDKAKRYYENDPQAKDGIMFKCFNDIDAHEILQEMNRLYPEVPIFFNYLFNTKTYSIENYRRPTTQERLTNREKHGLSE